MIYIAYIIIAWLAFGIASCLFFLLWFRFGKRFEKDRERLRKNG